MKQEIEFYWSVTRQEIVFKCSDIELCVPYSRKDDEDVGREALCKEFDKLHYDDITKMCKTVWFEASDDKDGFNLVFEFKGDKFYRFVEYHMLLGLNNAMFNELCFKLILSSILKMQLHVKSV